MKIKQKTSKTTSKNVVKAKHRVSYSESGIVITYWIKYNDLKLLEKNFKIKKSRKKKFSFNNINICDTFTDSF